MAPATPPPPFPPPPPPAGRTVALAVAVPLAVAAALGAGLWIGGAQERARNPWDRERFLSAAIDSVHRHTFATLPEPELLKRAVAGMLRELDDPYAALLEPDGVAAWRGGLRGEVDGLGMATVAVPGGARVRRVFGGSPAASAGFRAGDLVIGWSSVGERMVAAKVRRAGSADTIRLIARRTSWQRPLVDEVALLPGGVGHVRVPAMAEGAADALARAVALLEARGARRLVIDLRGNRGGVLQEGVDAASLFLARGLLVATLEAQGAERERWHSRDGRFAALPVLLLVDGRTASAAELFAAALRDHGRAALVGERTYGKPHVQQLVGLPGELTLRLTTALWHRPSGAAVALRADGRDTVGGLAPDHAVERAGRVDAVWLAGGDVPRAAAIDGVVEEAHVARWVVADDSTLLARLDSAIVSRADAAMGAAAPSRRGSRRDGTRDAVRSPMARTDDAASPAADVALARLLEMNGRTTRALVRRLAVDASLARAVALFAPVTAETSVTADEAEADDPTASR